MGNVLLENISKNESDMLRKFVGNTFIVEFGIIKEIPAEGIVTVEMSVADKADDIIITNCVYANLASSSFALYVKPTVDDKVIVLFPRKFSGAMFQKANNEAILTECSNGYSVTGGIAIPLNQYQETVHKNSINFADGAMSLKLASSDNSNLFTLDVSSSGTFTLKSNSVELSFSSDNSINIKNGKATITVDADGNVTVDTKGKYNFKNAVTSQKEVIDGLAQELENLTTTGSASAQETSPASLITIANWRTSKLNQLYS